jgi:hypothetical protein
VTAAWWADMSRNHGFVQMNEPRTPPVPAGTLKNAQFYRHCDGIVAAEFAVV